MHEPYRCVLLFGMPGVGKGTQGALLGRIPGYYHLATGDMFRALDPESDLGKKVKSYSSKGALVPDELTIELWDEHVKQRVKYGDYRPSRDLLVLDGIPRSVNQAQQMNDRITVLKVIHLKAPDLDVMVGRMKKRAEQQGRADDADEKVIRHRFNVYEQETSPVLSEYDDALICNLDATGSPDEVLLSVLKELVDLRENEFGNPLG